MSYLIAICLTILPFAFRTGSFIPYDYVRDIVFLTICVLLSLFECRKDVRFILPSLILLALAYFNQIDARLTSTLLQYLPFVGGLIILNSIDRTKIRRKHIQVAAYTTVTLATAFLVCNYFGFDPMTLVYPGQLRYLKSNYMNSTVAIVGNMAHPVPSAILIVCLIPFAKWLYPLGVLAIVLTNSATAFVSLVVVTCIMFWKHVQRYAKVVAFPAFVGVTYLGFAGFFDPSERWVKWGKIFSFVDRPILGHGLGYFREFFHKYATGGEKWFHAHNELLEVYAAFGIVGILVVGYLLSLIRVTRYNIDYVACFAGLLASSMFYFTFHNSPLALWGILCFVMITRRKVT